jgi:hypothetical protein
MPSLPIGDADSPIRIVITPSQSSFFAGEPFSVRITFTNTRSPAETVSAKPSLLSHKRGSHSISSAPLARPPTSPGTPRSVVVPAVLSATKGSSHDGPRRKNLIGEPSAVLSDDEQLPGLIERRRRRQLAPKSLSVSISPYDAFGVISSAPASQKSFSQGEYLLAPSSEAYLYCLQQPLYHTRHRLSRVQTH